MPNFWTKEQNDAILADRNNLLVCAAAGSGKTAVLCERILEKIITKGEDITDFLIVTFTVAAANELKEKLARKIKEALAANPKDSHLKHQLSCIGIADISTIDSFCLNIVKENFQDLGLPAKLRIADENELKVLEHKLMTEVVEDFYIKSADGKSDLFLDAADIFSDAKSDAVFVESLIKIYREYINFPMPEKRQRMFCRKLMNEYEEYKNNSLDFFDTSCGDIIRKEIKERINSCLASLNTALGLCREDIRLTEKYLPAIEDDIRYLSAISADSYAKTREILSEYRPKKFLPLTNFEDEALKERIASLRNYAKESIGQLRQLILLDEEEIFGQIKRTAEINSVICDIIEEFDSRYRAEKLEGGMMSFSDSTHYAFKILVKDFDYDTLTFERSSHAQEIAEKFKEIFIDEYQDVNLLQDIIFSAISKGENRFMVGDIKQSIYAFRGASPDIFKGYRDSFKDYEDKDSGKSVKIFLKNNFRCDSSVIDLTNALFSRLMNIKGKNDYLDEDKLVFTKTEDLKLPAEITLFDTDSSEYFYIAKRIRSLIDENITVEDRPLSYGDVAILTRDVKELAKIKEVLDTLGIPADAGGGEKVLDSLEVICAMAFLKAVDNPLDDISLVCLMTSPVFAFTSAQLLKIRQCSPNTAFYFALKGYDGEHKEKTEHFLEVLDDLRERSHKLSVDKLLWYIYDNISLVEILCRNRPEKRRKNLLCLHEYARNFEAVSHRGLGAFIEYIDSIRENGGGTVMGAQSGDFVRLMTAHKSKGLEFPVCFVAGLGKSFNTSDLRERMIFSPSLGRAFYLKDETGYVRLNTILRRAAVIEKNSRENDEELRLLYVAMTRAKHKLILTGTVQYKKSLYEKYTVSLLCDSLFDTSVSDASSYLEMLIYALSENKAFTDAFERYMQRNESSCASETGLKVDVICDAEEAQVSENKREKLPAPIFEGEKIAKYVNYLYPHTDAVTLPYKLSVSELRAGLLDEAKKPELIVLKEAPDFLSQATVSIAAQQGTAMHTFMQFADFDRCVKLGTAAEAERLVQDEFITPVQSTLLEHGRLIRFFESPLYKEMSKSPALFREKRFNLRLPAERFLKDKSKLKEKDLFILVQGVIDCFYKKENRYIVVDFKTDRVPNTPEGEEILRTRHSEQLHYYKLAVEEITGEHVIQTLIYSFALNREIKV